MYKGNNLERCAEKYKEWMKQFDEKESLLVEIGIIIGRYLAIKDYIGLNVYLSGLLNEDGQVQIKGRGYPLPLFR